MQQRKAEALGLSQRVDRVIFTDALGPGCAKPSPVAFERLMEDFGVRSQECAYVADNPRKDFVGPRNLGWLAVQFVSEGGIYQVETPPPDGQPHERISDLRQVLSLCLPGSKA